MLIRLIKIGIFTFSALATAVRAETMVPTFREWQYQALLAALRDPILWTRVTAMDLLDLGRLGYRPGLVPDELSSQVGMLVSSQNPFIRSAAIRALGNIGAAGASYAPQVAALLSNSDPDIMAEAAEALGNMGTAGAVYAEKVARLLDSPEPSITEAAVAALGNMGSAAAPYAGKMVDLLSNPDQSIRLAAAKALGNMGSAAAPYAKKVARLLDSPEPSITEAAVAALGNMEVAGAVYAKKVAALLDSPDLGTTRAAVAALGNMGLAAAPYAEKVAALLGSPDPDITAAAARALGNMGTAGAVYAEKVAALLGSPDLNIPAVAAEALGNMGTAGAVYAEKMAALLHDEYASIWLKNAAAMALGSMGDAGAAYAEEVAAAMLEIEHYTYTYPDARRSELAEALVSLGGIDTTPSRKQARLYCLETALKFQHDSGHIRAFCYLLGPRTEMETALLDWLGDRQGNYFRAHQDVDVDESRRILHAFSSVWPQLTKTPIVRGEVADQVISFIRANSTALTIGDVPALESWEGRLADAGFTAEAAAVREELGRIELYRQLRIVLLIVLSHLVIWGLLIWAYPRLPLVQSLFFWNTWARRFLGLGYVGLLITIVPALRRRLFLPFHNSLLPKASLAPFNAATYFPESEVSAKCARAFIERRSVSVALPSICGQVILEGESGLGKTTILLKLAQQSERIAVLLRATECSKGPVVAIQARLQGVVKDEAFLRALIHAGAIDVLIDGLNEATPITRAAIVQFVEESFRGNFILTTQPMDWEPPRTSEVLVLHPLRREQISEFLSRQWPTVSNQSICSDEKTYRQAVDSYMAGILCWGDDDARLRVLGNPMEACIVADMIARGEEPNLLGLLHQRFQSMEIDFINKQNRSFPYERFAEKVYVWRRSGEPFFPTDGFETEVAALVDHKLMIEREMEVKAEENAKTLRRWWFRHDKFMEYCLLPALLGDHAERREEHWQDEIMFGVYDLLALRLSDEEDRTMLTFLTEKAADHKRNELLNRYTIARRARSAHRFDRAS